MDGLLAFLRHAPVPGLLWVTMWLPLREDRAAVPRCLPELSRVTMHIVLGGSVLDPIRQTMACGGVSVELTPLETRLLYVLAAHPGQWLPWQDLLPAVWGHEARVESLAKCLQAVARLRRKLRIGGPHLRLRSSRARGLTLTQAFGRGRVRQDGGARG